MTVPAIWCPKLPASRPDPYKPKASIGEGSKFSVLSDQPLGANEVFHDPKLWPQSVSITHLSPRLFRWLIPALAFVSRTLYRRFG